MSPRTPVQHKAVQSFPDTPVHAGCCRLRALEERPAPHVPTLERLSALEEWARKVMGQRLAVLGTQKTCPTLVYVRISSKLRGLALLGTHVPCMYGGAQV